MPDDVLPETLCAAAACDERGPDGFRPRIDFGAKPIDERIAPRA